MAQLSYKHQQFINEYLDCFNATEAYSRVYPSAKRETCLANGSKLLGNTRISEEIQRRLAKNVMSVDEALSRLTDMARTDITGFLVQTKYINEKGIEKSVLGVDLEALQESGKGYLIRELSDSPKDGLKIKIHDAQSAISKILQIHGKVTGREEHRDKDGNVTKTVDTVSTVDYSRLDENQRDKQAASAKELLDLFSGDDESDE